MPTRNIEYSKDEIVALIEDGSLIPLIKAYRDITGEGLKASKDAIEKARNSNSGLYDLFAQEMENWFTPLSKKEFFDLIEHSIDNMSTFYFNDMLKAVDCLIQNIKEYGGLDEIAKDRERFLQNL